MVNINFNKIFTKNYNTYEALETIYWKWPDIIVVNDFFQIIQASRSSDLIHLIAHHKGFIRP